VIIINFLIVKNKIVFQFRTKIYILLNIKNILMRFNLIFLKVRKIKSQNTKKQLVTHLSKQKCQQKNIFIGINS